MDLEFRQGCLIGAESFRQTTAGSFRLTPWGGALRVWRGGVGCGRLLRGVPQALQFLLI